jgi:hypothetical protein
MRIPPAIHIENSVDFDRSFILTCAGTQTPVGNTCAGPDYPSYELPTARNLSPGKVVKAQDRAQNTVDYVIDRVSTFMGSLNKSPVASAPAPTPRAEALKTPRYRQKTSVCEKAVTLAAAFAFAAFCCACKTWLNQS